MATVNLNDLTPEQLAMLQNSMKNNPPIGDMETEEENIDTTVTIEQPQEVHPEPKQEPVPENIPEPTPVQDSNISASAKEYLNKEVEAMSNANTSVNANANTVVKEQVEDRHNIVDVTVDNKQLKEIEETKDTIDAISMPSTSMKEFGKYTNKLDELTKIVTIDNDTGEENIIGRKKIENVFERKKDQTAVYRNIEAGDYTTFEDAFYDRVNEVKDGFVNDINYSDKKVNPRKINFEVKNKVSGKAAIARFTALLGIGEVVQIPLWHSGIWVTIEPPKQKDIINLQIALSESQISLGRKTVGLVYSNESVIYNRIVANFIKRHIVESTMILPEGDDIFEYICIQDFYPLILGMLTAMYPDGITHTKACVNTYELDDNGEPKCDNIVKGLIDPRKMLWLDRQALTSKLLEHMSKKQPNSQTVDAVKEYQASIKRMAPKHVTIKTSNEKEIDFTLALPNLRNYIDKGERWIERVMTDAESLFTSDDTTETKNNKIGDILLTVYMGVYNSYVDGIKISDTELDRNSADYQEDLQAALDLISLDNEAFTEFRSEVMKYINESVIAVVGIPNYTCEKCQASQVNKANMKHTNFKEIIPLNILEPFFALCGLRTQKAISKTI